LKKFLFTGILFIFTDQNAPPKANAGGDFKVSLPISVLKLNGSRSSDDLAVVRWKWTRDESSLAQGTVLDDSDSSPILMVNHILSITIKTGFKFYIFQLGDVVAGQYVFKLKVEDEQGVSSEDTATVIVNPGI